MPFAPKWCHAQARRGRWRHVDARCVHRSTSHERAYPEQPGEAHAALSKAPAGAAPAGGLTRRSAGQGEEGASDVGINADGRESPAADGCSPTPDTLGRRPAVVGLHHRLWLHPAEARGGAGTHPRGGARRSAARRYRSGLRGHPWSLATCRTGATVERTAGALDHYRVTAGRFRDGGIAPHLAGGRDRRRAGWLWRIDARADSRSTVGPGGRPTACERRPRRG
jgi:hypothetical protein